MTTTTTTATTATTTARAFVYDGREFPDPDPNLSVEEVRKQFAEFLPELANADTREEKRADGTVVYSFSKRIGTKGQPRGTGRTHRVAYPSARPEPGRHLGLRLGAGLGRPCPGDPGRRRHRAHPA